MICYIPLCREWEEWCGSYLTHRIGLASHMVGISSQPRLARDDTTTLGDEILPIQQASKSVVRTYSVELQKSNPGHKLLGILSNM